MSQLDEDLESEIGNGDLLDQEDAQRAGEDADLAPKKSGLPPLPPRKATKLEDTVLVKDVQTGAVQRAPKRPRVEEVLAEAIKENTAALRAVRDHVRDLAYQLREQGKLVTVNTLVRTDDPDRAIKKTAKVIKKTLAKKPAPKQSVKTRVKRAIAEAKAKGKKR